MLQIQGLSIEQLWKVFLITWAEGIMTKIPRIGLSACMMHPDFDRPLFKGKRLLYMEESMFHWLMSCGGHVYLLPTTVKPEGIIDLVASLDGVVLSGGSDMAPVSYGEKPIKEEWAGDEFRDRYEFTIVNACLKLDRPILGICRGMQMLNVSLGGTLYQDITTQRLSAKDSKTLIHRDWDVYEHNYHQLKIEKGSLLSDLYKDIKPRKINSVHHQGVKKLGADLLIEAISPEDGIVEAIRFSPKSTSPFSDRFAFGLQWHPEFQDHRDETLLPAAPILREFYRQINMRMGA
jgi:putative glutamine amidotransferase